MEDGWCSENVEACQLGPKEAPPGSRIEPRYRLNPKSPEALAIPKTTSFRSCSRAARAGDNSGGEPCYCSRRENGPVRVRSLTIKEPIFSLDWPKELLVIQIWADLGGGEDGRSLMFVSI